VEHGRDLFNLLQDKDNIIISTWQSWSSWLSDGIAIKPDYVIVDEAHTLAKKKLPWTYMDAFSHTRYRYGLTATENEMIYDRLTLEGLLGPVLYKELPEKLIEQGFLAKPHIHRVFIRHTMNSIDRKIRTSDMVRSTTRMVYLSSYIDSFLPSDESLLILTEAVEEEIIPLADILRTTLTDTDIYTLTRIARRKERAEIIGLVNEPKGRTILVVTYGLFQMGIDIPNLKYILLFTPSRSHIRVLQSIGRALRPKDLCHIYDIIDYCDEKRDNMASKRLSIYRGAYGDQCEIINEYVEL